MDTNPSGIMPDNACKHPLLTDIKVLKQAEHLMASRITLLNPQLTAPPLHGKKKKKFKLILMTFVPFPATVPPCPQNSPGMKCLLKQTW